MTLPMDPIAFILPFLTYQDQFQFAQCGSIVSKSIGKNVISYMKELKEDQHTLNQAFKDEIRDIALQSLHSLDSANPNPFRPSYDRVKEYVYLGANVNQDLYIKDTVGRKTSLLSLFMMCDTDDDTFRSYVIRKMNWASYVADAVEWLGIFDNDSHRVLDTLCQCGFSASHILHNGQSVLGRAIELEYVETSAILFKHGADVNHIDTYNMSILMNLVETIKIAHRRNDPVTQQAFVQLLRDMVPYMHTTLHRRCRVGASIIPNRVVIHTMTPSEYALDSELHDVVQLLKDVTLVPLPSKTGFLSHEVFQTKKSWMLGAGLALIGVAATLYWWKKK